MDMVGHPLLFHNLETVSLCRSNKDSFQRSRYRVFQHHPPVLRDPNKMVLKLVHGMARSSVFHAKYFNTLRSGSLGGRLLRTHKGCGIRQRNGEMRRKFLWINILSIRCSRRLGAVCMAISLIFADYSTRL